MKEIQLSTEGKSRGKHVALVDDEDFERLNQYKWAVLKKKHTFYALRCISVDGKQSMRYMHCEILKGKGIDHKDHNGLNNQKNNLRFCTQRENNMNRSKRENTSSVYKGVSFFKESRKWRAQIMINGKVIHIGLFASEVDAAKAYNIKAIELFGEFANLNIID